MTVLWIVIGVAVLVAGVLAVLELQNRRRARALDGLSDGDPSAGARAMSEADAARSATEGHARSAHQGISGAGGMGPG